jgi:hypothetical protein
MLEAPVYAALAVFAMALLILNLSLYVSSNTKTTATCQSTARDT